MKSWIPAAIVIAALLLAGGWVWYERTHTGATAAPLQEEFDWSFVSLGVSSSTPYTDVSLKVAGVEVPLGKYPGDCFAVAGSPAPLLSGELSGAICTWQSSGQEIGVFEEGGALTLMQGSVTGTDTATLSRTNFVPLKRQP